MKTILSVCAVAVFGVMAWVSPALACDHHCVQLVERVIVRERVPVVQRQVQYVEVPNLRVVEREVQYQNVQRQKVQVRVKQNVRVEKVVVRDVQPVQKIVVKRQGVLPLLRRGGDINVNVGR